MDVRAQLIPLNGGEAINIAKDLILVGRKQECDLQLDHKSVSKVHCVIVKTDGLLLVRDLGSTNGTRVNGQRIRRAALLPNDKLTIAQFQYKVQLGPAVDSPAHPHEPTMAMSPKEAESLRAKNREGGPADSEPEVPAIPIKTNALPDVYPEGKKGKR